MNATPRNSRPEAVESKISLQVLRQLSVKYADETKNLKDNRLEESDKQQLLHAIAEAESYKADLAGSDLSGADADSLRRLGVFTDSDQDFVSHFKAHVDGTYPQLNEVTWADFAGNLQAFVDALDAARTYFDGQASGVAMTDVNGVQIDNRKERRLETAFGGKIENNPELLGEFVAKLSEGSDSYADLYRMMSVRSPKEKVEQLAYLYRLVNQRADKIRESLNAGQRVKFDELIARIREDVDVEFELSGGGRLERWSHVVTVVQPDGTEAYYWDDDRRGLGGNEDPWEILDTENPQESLRLACEFDEDGDPIKGELADYINYKDKLDRREARKARAAELEREADEAFRTPLANKIADLTEEYVLQKGREGATGEIADDFARSRGRERVAAEIYVELMDVTKPVKPTDSANEEGMDDYRRAMKAYDDRLKLFAGAVRVRPAARSHIERKISNMILNTVYVGKGRYNVFKDETEGALTFDDFQKKFPGAVDGVNDILLALLPPDKKNDPAARHQLILDLYKAIETRGSGSREAMVLYRRATMFIPNAWHESNFEQLLSVLKHYEDRDRQPKVWSLQETHGGWERIEGSEVTGEPAQAYLDVDLGNYQDAMAILRDNYRDLPTMLREKGANTVEYKSEIHGLLKVLCQQFRYFGNNDFAAVKEHYASHPELLEQFQLNDEKIATLYAVYGLMKDARFEDWGALYKYLLYIEEDDTESPKVPRVRFIEGPVTSKLDVAVVDVEEKIRKISRRLAEERYEREMGQLIQDRKGASWFKKPWHFLKGYGRSIARQGFVDKYEVEYAEKLRNEPNFFEEMMSGEAGGELASHKAEVNAILNRFEMGDVTAEEVIADVEGEVYMQDLDNLAKAYLIGDVDDVEFGRRATRMVYQIRREHIIGADAEGTDDKLVATDVVERMRDLKRRHVQGLTNLDLDNFRIALKVGKAMNVDVHSEVSTTRADGWVKGLQTWSAKHSMLKWFASPSAASIGAYAIVNSAYNLFASTTGRVAVGGVLGIIAAPAIGPAAAAALTGIAVGAGMAAMHRNRSVIMQEAQKNRRQALGHYEQAADGTFEYKLGQVTAEKVAATDLISNMDQAITAGDYQAIARAVAEIEVRNEMSYEERSERKGGKVDTIKFSDEKHVERERTAMLAKARAGRNWMESNHDPEDNVEDDLKAAATAVRDGIDNMIVGKDKEFRSLKFRENMKAASIGALFGLATSAAGYGLSVAVNKIWGPFGHDAVLNSDALADIKKFVDDNGLDANQVAYGANGELTPASVAYLEAHGIHVNPIGTSAGCPEVSAYGPPDTSQVVTLPSGDTVTLEYPHDYPMPATIDQAWLDAHCSVTIVPGSGGSFAGSGANVLTHLEGSGVVTHAEVLANPGWVDSSGNLTTAGVTALNGKGVGIVYNPGPSSVVTSTTTISTGSLTDPQWKSLGFERETLTHHWHNGTPKVFENPHELNLWWGTKGGVDAHGDVVLTIDQMLKGGAGPTRVAGGGQLDVSAAFSRGELSLYAAVKDGSGHLRYMPFPIKADGSVTFDSTVGRMLWDTSGPKPKFLGEYVMCAQEAGGKLSSLAKVDGTGALGGLEVITEKTVTGDGSWKAAWESAGEKSYSFSSDEMIPGDCPNIPYAFTKEGTHDIYIMPPIVVKNPNALEKVGKTERAQNGLVDKYGNLVAANGDPLDMEIVRTTYTDPIGSSPWTEWDWGTLLDEDEDVPPPVGPGPVGPGRGPGPVPPVKPFPPSAGPSFPPSAGPSFPPSAGPSFPPSAGPSFPPSAGPSFPSSAGPTLRSTGSSPRSRRRPSSVHTLDAGLDEESSEPEPVDSDSDVAAGSADAYASEGAGSHWWNFARTELDEHGSETLKGHPEATLNHYHEIKEYFERQDASYMEDIRKLSGEIGPMDTECKASICIPVAAHQEGANIYRALSCFKNQTMESDKFEIILMCNHPKTTRDGSKVSPDNTLEEIQRFRQDNPGMRVRMVYKTFDLQDAKIGTMRKIANDIAMYRHHQRGEEVEDLILVSTDADIKGVSPRYVETYVEKLSEDPKLDAALGQLDWDLDSYSQNPLVHVGTRLFQYLNMIGRSNTNSMTSSGGNFAFKSSIYAAIGGHPMMGGGEDVLIGMKIQAARRSNKTMTFAGAGTRNFVSSRRAESAIRKGLSPVEQWTDGFGAFDEVRNMSLYEGKQIDFDNSEELERFKVDVTNVISRTLKTYAVGEGISMGHSYFRRALGFLGVDYSVIKDADGNEALVITDMSKLVKGLKEYQEEGSLIQKAKSGDEEAKQRLKSMRKIRKQELARDHQRIDQAGRLEVETYLSKSAVRLPHLPQEKFSIEDLRASTEKVELGNGLVMCTDKVLGGGFMATIYAGYNRKTGEMNAFKQYKLEERDYIRSSNRYPEGIASSVDYAREKGLVDNPYLDFPEVELVRGSDVVEVHSMARTDLDSYIKVNGPLVPQDALGIAIQVAAGLNSMHEEGMIHADVGATNILIFPDGSPKLGDMNGVSIKNKGAVIRGFTGGNKWISPPEPHHENVRLTRSADTYELCVTLYESLTGQFPYHHAEGVARADRPNEYLKLHTLGQFDIPDTVPAPIAAILRKGINPDKSKRYQDMDMLLSDLVAAARSLPAAGVSTPSPLPPSFGAPPEVPFGGPATAPAQPAPATSPVAPASPAPAPSVPPSVDRPAPVAAPTPVPPAPEVPPAPSSVDKPVSAEPLSEYARYGSPSVVMNGEDVSMEWSTPGNSFVYNLATMRGVANFEDQASFAGFVVYIAQHRNIAQAVKTVLLSGNINGIAGLALCSNLATLDLEGSQATDYSPLRVLKNLRVLTDAEGNDYVGADAIKNFLYGVPAGPADVDTVRDTEMTSFREVTVTPMIEGDPTAQEILSRAQIHATRYKGEMLTVDDIRRFGLGPKEKISFDGTDVYVSDPYDIGHGRVARIGYVRDTRTGEVVARSFYRSNSMGLWRFLAGYTTDRYDGEINWYGKAWSEESTTLPAKLQKALCEDASPAMYLAEPDKVFAGLARGHSLTDTWMAQIDRRSDAVNGVFHADNPERIGFSDPQDAPDFAHTVESFETQTDQHGAVHVDVFLSANGKYRYMMCNDGKRAWMAGGEIVGAKVTSLGANENWINLGSLTMPATEYRDQVSFSYQGAPIGAHYVDTFEKFLSRIPVIRRYCESIGIASPSATVPVGGSPRRSDINPNEYDFPSYSPEAFTGGIAPTPVEAEFGEDDDADDEPVSPLDVPSPPTPKIGGEPVSNLVPPRGDILPPPSDDADGLANTGLEINFFGRGDVEADEVLPPLPPVKDDDESPHATF